MNVEDKNCPKSVISALLDWGEADYDWSNDPTNKHLEHEAERLRKRYVKISEKYGVKPVQGAVRD